MSITPGFPCRMCGRDTCHGCGRCVDHDPWPHMGMLCGFCDTYTLGGTEPWPGRGIV